MRSQLFNSLPCRSRWCHPVVDSEFGLVISKQTSVVISGAERQRGREAHPVFAKHRKPTSQLSCKRKISNKLFPWSGPDQNQTQRVNQSTRLLHSSPLSAEQQHGTENICNVNLSCQRDSVNPNSRFSVCDCIHQPAAAWQGRKKKNQPRGPPLFTKHPSPAGSPALPAVNLSESSSCLTPNEAHLQEHPLPAQLPSAVHTPRCASKRPVSNEK